jgi:hypothetical protein
MILLCGGRITSVTIPTSTGLYNYSLRKAQSLANQLAALPGSACSERIPRVAPDTVCLPGYSQQKYLTTRASTVGEKEQDQRRKHALYEAMILWEALMIPMLRSVPVIIIIIVVD